jgi:hypothetical protein
MKHITTEDALRALEEAVAEKGEDYVYPLSNTAADLCAYTEFNDRDELVPSCLVGNALHRLGVPLEAMAQFNTGHGPKSLAEELGLDGDRAAWLAFRDAQAIQDDGGTWGAALAKAKAASYA